VELKGETLNRKNRVVGRNQAEKIGEETEGTNQSKKPQLKIRGNKK